MKNKITAEKFYDNFASTYDQTLKDPTVNAQHIHEAAKLFNQTQDGKQGSVLDIGCGTGLLKDLLNGHFEYTGIDISENMLHYAAKRGYKTIHGSTENVLPTIANASYDYVFALSSLLFVEDTYTAVEHINRIARQSFLLSLDHLTDDYINTFSVKVYDHSSLSIPNAKEDYFIRGWTSPTTGITIKTRIIYVEK